MQLAACDLVGNQATMYDHPCVVLLHPPPPHLPFPRQLELPCSGDQANRTKYRYLQCQGDVKQLLGLGHLLFRMHLSQPDYHSWSWHLVANVQIWSYVI